MPSNTSKTAVLAVDQGTSSTKALLVSEGSIIARASVAIVQQHPQAGWVEQNPTELLDSVYAVVEQLRVNYDGQIVTIGLSTQRESALAWDTITGEPLSPVIGWQDRRTARRARTLAESAQTVRSISGLPLDPMFSALKFEWILDQIDPERTLARAGKIALGTVDSWLLYKLTGEHRIEIGNASRTQLLDLKTGQWSEQLLALFNIPRAALPRVVDSDAISAHKVLGMPLGAVLGDSHAALYAHGVRKPGDVKVTYGTGSSVMGLSDVLTDGPGLVGTIAWGIGGQRSKAFEGNILSTGATVKWLAELFNMSPDELADHARSATSSSGLDIVPAFHGLGAPWWDEQATGIISGLQLGSGIGQLARAAFESIALQIDDVLCAAERETGVALGTVLVDGGPSRNDWLMQLQADLARRTFLRHDGTDLSALGVASLAARTLGLGWEESPSRPPRTEFLPAPMADRDVRRGRWDEAVARARVDLSATADAAINTYRTN